MKIRTIVLLLAVTIICLTNIPTDVFPIVEEFAQSTVAGRSHSNKRENIKRTNVDEKNKPQQIINNLSVDDHTHVFPIEETANEISNEHVFLRVTFRVETEKELLGTDEPVFTISAHDTLLYQLTRDELRCIHIQPCKTDWITISFRVDDKTTRQSISVWATKAEVAFLETFTKTIDDVSSVGPVQELVITRDTDEYSTLEWLAPESLDNNIDKSLRYEFKYSHTDDLQLLAWSNLPDVIVLEPVHGNTLAKMPHHRELRLIKNDEKYPFVLIRAFDWQGNAGPIMAAT